MHRLFAYDIASGEVTDLMPGQDRMLDKGYLDASRIAAASGSYGGYLVSGIGKGPSGN